jgi:AhpD family alkylhydroperoxidase
MEARMKNPAFVVPGAMDALQALGASLKNGSVDASTLAMAELRASQINGCSLCVDLHSRELRKEGESDERIFGVGAWRESPYFSAGERAALALAEALTRLADRPDAVDDELWDEVCRHHDESARATLLMAIAGVNVWNRLNAATRQPAGLVW